ncbi:MAG TPA: Ig-like domain-containing protein, partial [Candidatus Eisenbacteria bacterium]
MLPLVMGPDPVVTRRASRPVSRLRIAVAGGFFLSVMSVTAFAPDTSFAADSPIIFTAVGDVPYGDSEVSTFQGEIEDHNVYSPSEFFVHLGDIFSGSESCEEFRYSRVADIMHMLTVPAYVIPGDNETTDCSNPGSGWQLWTEYFLRFEDYFCGTPLTERQSGRQENFAFVKNGVLFCGINLVGGTNDSQILEDDANWVTQQLQAKKPNVRAAVVFAQAGPGSNHSIFFDPFTTAASSFAKPILYLHGDGHSWLMDRPLSGAQNVLRVQVERAGNSPPLQVTVTLDTTNPFQFNRDPWASHTAYNRPPCVNAGPDKSIALGQSVTLSGAATDNWVPYNPPRLTYSWSKTSGPGTVTFSAPSALATSASFSAGGTYVLRLTVNDTALSGTDDVTVVVGSSGTNQPPVATNDTYEVETDLTLSVTAPGVLANDSDPEGAPLTAAMVTQPSHGTLSLASNGSFTYTPAAGYFGPDGFTYRANDGLASSNTATVTINVGIRFATFAASHDARVSLSSPTSNYGTSSTLRVQGGSSALNSYLKFDVNVGPVTAATLRLYVTDASPDGGSVHSAANTYVGSTTAWTETGINWNNAPPISSPALDAAGAVSANTWTDLDVTAGVPGSGTYSLGIDATSTDPAYYSSKEGSQPPQLVITYRFGSAANNRPVAQDNAYSLNEDASLTVAAPGVLGNDTDADGDPLTATVTSSPANGSVALQPTGGFTYTPAANFSGTDWFTYTVSDGRGGTDIGSVTLTVNPRPDPPTALNDSYSVVVNNSLVVAAPGVLGNDSDLDGETLTASLVTAPVHGVLTLGANGSFTYTPNSNFLGADSFTYRAQDPGGLNASATVSIQVTPPPPVTLTFTPAADAYVSEAKPTTNYGTATDVRVQDRRTDFHSYLRFVVSGTNAVSGTLLSVKLQLHCEDGGPDGGSFYAVSNNYLGTTTPWTETGINWSNAPA